MRKIKIITISSLLLFGSLARAGSYIVSEDITYRTDEIQKIVFNEDKVEVNLLDGENIIYDFSSLQRLYFTSNETTENLKINNENLEFYLYPNPAINKVHLKGMSIANSKVYIYDNNQNKCIMGLPSC